MGPHSTLFLTVVLCTCVGLQSPAMNQLSVFNGVHPGLSRQEFVELLRVFSTDSQRSLRADLFAEACDLGLILDGLRGLPLVDDCDSALRPMSKVLSNDVWLIVQSINNHVYVPRTILKTEKEVTSFYNPRALTYVWLHSPLDLHVAQVYHPQHFLFLKYHPQHFLYLNPLHRTQPLHCSRTYQPIVPHCPQVPKLLTC